MNRRKFLKNTGATILGTSPLLRVGAGLSATSGLANATTEEFTDYKALIVLILDGGNDSLNMFLPTDPDRHSEYENVRGAGKMAIGIQNLDDETLTTANGHYVKQPNVEHPYFDETGTTDASSVDNSYRKGSYHLNDRDGNPTGMGINSMMPELAAMYKAGKFAVVSGIGTLVRPTTKEEILNETADLPVFLFAHNHQRRAVGTAQAEKLGTVGWAGKIADAWQMNEPIGLNLTYGNISTMQLGVTTSPLKMEYVTPAFITEGAVPPYVKVERVESLLSDLNDIPNDNIFSSYYAKNVKRAGELSTLLTNSMATAPDFSTFSATNTYGLPLFSYEKNDSRDAYTKDILNLDMHDPIEFRIFSDFESVAKMIKVAKDTLGYKRQIIHIRMTGYDLHSAQIKKQLIRFRSLSLAISDFQKSLEEMEIDDKVLTVSFSDFGRALLDNGDGTDHGWGGHTFMFSGDPTFQGGNVFGEVLDDMRLDGKNCFRRKGQVIPTTSIEQMLAPALKWFGVSDSLLPMVLPNLKNFQTDDTMESAFLQGVFS